MLKNIFTGLSGALAQEKVLDILANNLANVNTPAFKEQNVTFKTLEPEPHKNYRDPVPPANYKVPFEDLLHMVENDMKYVGVSGVTTDFGRGSVSITHNPMDVMLENSGFFAVNTKEGVRFSRDGSWTLSPSGALVDGRANPIVGEKGPIFLQGHKISINPIGEVYQDGKYVDRIKVYDFKEKQALERVGQNYYYHTGSQENQFVVDFPQFKQGAIESSNVNAMRNLTKLIVAHRSHEAYNKAIKNYDGMMEKSNRIGEVRG